MKINTHIVVLFGVGISGQDVTFIGVSLDAVRRQVVDWVIIHTPDLVAASEGKPNSCNNFANEYDVEKTLEEVGLEEAYCTAIGLLLFSCPKYLETEALLVIPPEILSHENPKRRPS